MKRLLFCILSLIFGIAQTFANIGTNISEKDDSHEGKKAKTMLTIGTIGHLDHGKTTLTAAITRVLAKLNLSDYYSFDLLDSSPKEKEYGITIEVDAIEYETQNRHYKHIDCPGHPDYIDNTKNALSKMDGAILVISATEGIMPQTNEHIRLAYQENVSVLAVFINKCDMVGDTYIIDQLEKDIRKVLTECGYDGVNSTVIKGSALGALIGLPEWEEKIKDLIEVLDSWTPQP